MSLFESYDESEEIVKPEKITQELKRLPEIAIVCFKKELIEIIEKSNEFEEYSFTRVAGENIKIYKTTYKGKDIILYRTIMGGPATAAMMEEMISRGVKKFIFFGSCGTLEEKIESGAFIIPSEAYRDEGTSYHYLPVSDFVKIDTAKQLDKIFEKHNIKHIYTKTWTTDALYKETVDKTKRRLEEGCKVVEMECASIMAVSKVRNVKAYQFLYSDDTLDGEEWNIRTLKSDRSSILQECLKIALKVSEEI